VRTFDSESSVEPANVSLFWVTTVNQHVTCGVRVTAAARGKRLFFVRQILMILSLAASAKHVSVSSLEPVLGSLVASWIVNLLMQLRQPEVRPRT
jgi:hypothetical protein